VIAGVVGNRKYQYDVWGDTVNIAARMETAASPGSVCIPAELWKPLSGAACRHEHMGKINVKGKGLMELVKIEPSLS